MRNMLAFIAFCLIAFALVGGYLHHLRAMRACSFP